MYSPLTRHQSNCSYYLGSVSWMFFTKLNGLLDWSAAQHQCILACKMDDTIFSMNQSIVFIQYLNYHHKYNGMRKNSSLYMLYFCCVEFILFLIYSHSCRPLAAVFTVLHFHKIQFRPAQ